MARGKTLLSIGVIAYDLLSLIGSNNNIYQCREFLKQTPQQQTHTINTLIKANCIKKVTRGVYTTTEFGDYIIKHLRNKRANRN